LCASISSATFLKPTPALVMRIKIILLLALQLVYVPGIAQSILQSLNDTATVKADDMHEDAPPILAKKWNHFHTKYFTLNIGISLLLDHNEASQDDDNIQQVGEI